MNKASPSIIRNLDALIAAFAGFWIIFAFSRQGGIGVSPDSVVYISVATNIHDHGVINDFTRAPLMDFPFFYPIFLSAIMFITRLSCLQFGAILNSLLFGLLIYGCGVLMERFSFRQKWYKWVLLTFIVLSPCLLEVYSMLWSETLFLLLILLFFILLHKYLQNPSRRILLTMALIAGLSCITRYAGITLIGTGCMLILLDFGRPLRRRIGHILLFGATALLLPLVNLIRNRLMTGTLTGYREKAIRPFSANLYDFGSVFCDWMPFFNPRYKFAALIGAAWFLLLLALFLGRLVKKERARSAEHIVTAYFIVYSVFILFTASVSRFQPLDSRLLSPLFLPWIWGATAWIPSLLQKPQLVRWQKALIISGAILVAIGFQYGQLVDDYETWDGVKEAGIPGYTEADWRNSQTMGYVNANKKIFQRPGMTLYSNAFEGVWFLTGIKCDLIPHKEFTKDVKEFLAEDHFYLLWFNDGVNPDLLSIDFISHHKTLAAEKIFNDGAIYYYVTDSTAWKHPPFQ